MERESMKSLPMDIARCDKRGCRRVSDCARKVVPENVDRVVWFGGCNTEWLEYFIKKGEGR